MFEHDIHWLMSLSFPALLRNSLVGAAVFETYVYTISKVASPPGCEEEGKEKGVAKQENESGDNDPLIKMSDGDLVDDDEDDTEETIPLDAPDVFSRASLLAHVGAGALAGSLDGLLSSIWESKSQPNSFQFFLKKARHLVLQQCISHALLFGSYEWCKRSMIHRMRSSQLGEWNIKDSGLSRLGCIAVAGGLAGQLQFLTNHYGEQIQEIQTNKSHIRNQTPRNQLSVNLRLRMRELKHPSMGPMIAAFVPSAVGFVAFEYGKQLGS